MERGGVFVNSDLCVCGHVDFALLHGASLAPRREAEREDSKGSTERSMREKAEPIAR